MADSVDIHKEVLRRIGEGREIATKLRLFSSKARTTIKRKLQVVNSIKFSKLLYGLETVQLTQNEQARIDAFQMRRLRRVLGVRVPPTYLDRSWTNQKVVDTLSQRHEYQSCSWRQKNITLLGHILRPPFHNPMREVFFESGTATPRIEHLTRVGKPEANLLLDTFQDVQDMMSPSTLFEMNNHIYLNEIARKAQNRIALFATRSPHH